MGTGSMSHVKVCVSVCVCRSPAIPRQPRHLQTSNFQCRKTPKTQKRRKSDPKRAERKYNKMAKPDRYISNSKHDRNCQLEKNFSLIESFV